MQEELIERCEILKRLRHHYEEKLRENHKRFWTITFSEVTQVKKIENEYLQLRIVILSQLKYIENELKEWKKLN